jgi:glycine/serine hydroxymethyltransferase
MQESDMASIASWIDRALDAADDPAALAAIRNEVKEFCAQFPAPGIRID